MRTSSVDISGVWLEPTPESVPILPDALFEGVGQVELEIGCGKGLFLLRESQARPDVGFIGIEWSAKYSRYAAQRIAKREVRNARVFHGDARAITPRFPVASFAAVHLYFPDPWWKQRHKKRRILDSAFVEELVRLLPAGGEFHFATDVEEYYRIGLATLAEHRQMRRRDDPPVHEPEDDLDYPTNFERKYRLEGRAIHRALFARVDR